MRRTLPLALALAACTAHAPSPPQATSAAAESRRAPAAPVPLATYFETRRLYGVSFSSDERQVAFASDLNGRPDVYVEAIEGGPATQITHVNGQLWTFDFSPSEDRLVYQTDVGGDENTRLYLTDHRGSAPVEITAGDPADRRAEYVDWSRDGRTLLYLSNRRNLEFMDLYEYEVEGGKSKMIWQAAGKIAFAAVSHDHRRIALAETISDVDSNLYLVDGEQQRLLTPHQRPGLSGAA